jgi:HEAT repeat protein
LSYVDTEHRLNYAQALGICGTARSRPTLGEWTRDSRREVSAAAFEALSHVGLDASAASLAVGALESDDVAIRATAAAALRGWTADAEAARHLVQHLDDAWPVAVSAARSLQSMPESGMAALRARAERPDLAGTLARQMLWEAEVRR